MDNLERTMQFILDMQPKHEAWLQEHKEALKKHDEAMSRIDGAIEANTARIAQLVDVTLSLAHHAEETDRRIKELTESQAHCDRRLDALIDVVDKLARRNGGTPKH